MFASIATFALEGIDSREVSVEVDVRRGLPVFTIVGLPDPAVREARERVRAALLNSGLEFPLKRMTANLAPADVRKAGPSFDLALAVAVLAASGQIARDGLGEWAVCGELSLSGVLRPVRGALAMSLGARRGGFRRLIVPTANAAEAALVEGVEVSGVQSLARIVELMAGRWRPEPPVPLRSTGPEPEADEPDLADVRGQADAKRALELAAAGGHNLLMVGPPGVGKTMLACRLPGILPRPSLDEAVEITRVQSVAGLADGGLARRRPFRAPHHTISASGLVGGGATPRPGEITLAHHGVLFLDELAEFSRAALEALRQPLETRRVLVSRGQTSIAFPAHTQLVAASNACPCARLRHECTCTEADHARYARKLSGPLLDRIDLVCRLEAPPPSELTDEGEALPESRAIRRRVELARERQRSRSRADAASNAAMGTLATRRHALLSVGARTHLRERQELAPLGARGHDRVLKLARTIADLDQRAEVSVDDLDEALGFRLGGGSARRAA